MPLRILTLPALRVVAPSGEVTALQGHRLPLAVLVYLAVERSVPRDSLMALLWPERDEERARHSLSQTLYELRRDLGEDILASAGDVVALAAGVECDVVRFEAAVERGQWAAALELYGGGFLEGLHLVPSRPFEDWVDRRRGGAARHHRRARREALAERMRAGDLASALALASRWAELEPLDDEAQQRTIELLARTGRRADALRQYEGFEQRLREDDLEPMPELAQLVAGLRQGTVGAPSAGGIPVAAGAPTAGPAGLQTMAALVPPGPGAAAAGGPLPGLPSELEVVRPLAEGRQARVYLAREPALGRLVAVKVLAPGAAADTVALRRFQREARALARIRHPNVAPVYRVGALADGAWYLVLPYIDGGSLEDRLAARGPLPLPEARKVLAQLAGALAAAHRLGIVHRDVRPANVLYDRDSDRSILVDFGTAGLQESGDSAEARLTRPGEQLGMPAYASPEQLRGDVATDRSDVYSLGVVAFEILAGRLPFEAATPLEMTAAHMEAQPPSLATLRPDVPAELDALVRRCLNKRPEQRPWAEEVVEGVEV